MAALKGFLLLLIISFLASSIRGQITRAQVSKSWVNSNVSLRSYGSARIILFTWNSTAIESLDSDNKGFCLAFYANHEEKNSFFLAIGWAETYNTYTYISGPRIDLRFTNVWSANRNKPVHENATLQLISDGNLVLRDANGILVWTTNTSNKSVVGMEMMENGNLVLHDINNYTIWQSFDHPTNTLLVGQKLMPGQKLVADISETNISEGNYEFAVTFQGLSAFYQANVPLKYLNVRYVATDSFDIMETIELNYHGSSLALYAKSVEGETLQIIFQSPTNNSALPRLKFDHDGHLRLDDFDNYSQPVYDVLERYLTACDYPTFCGSFALCSAGRCSCPADFAPEVVSDAQTNFACLAINPSPKTCVDSHSLLSMPDVYYFNYIDEEAAFVRGTDFERCKNACMVNCSCKAALFRYFHNFSRGDCYFPSPVLSFITDGKQKYNYHSYAFIKTWKAENGEEGGRGAQRSANHRRLVIALTVGVSLPVALFIGVWVVFLRKKKDREEDLEDFLYQLSGMPIKFTFEELKVATGDFQKKLGEGGFGSVFEGSLQNREKIAVKRLDSIGQGKKEFMAEVKTIGSIHHVNLVRLIGFCTEKFHRLLVYEFMWNGSLDKWIFNRQPHQPTLDWETVTIIILDIAKGLAYLHDECTQRIVHLDIKPQNILLGADLHAKIADFGLSKLIDKDESQVVTTMRGTPGYMAPEWFSSIITEKADVYSFGIVVMEIICGRRNLDRLKPEDCMHLLPIFMRKAEEDQLIDMVDSCNENMKFHESEALKMMRVAVWCLQSDFKRRPSMSAVVKVLEGTMDVDAELDYSIQFPAKMVAMKRETEGGTLTQLSSSLLSGPR